MEVLKGNIRIKNNGNSAGKERRRGLIPGVLYGKGQDNLLFEIGDMELNNYFNKHNQHGSLEIDVEGKTYKTLIKEVQRDPVSKKIIHMDLETYGEHQKLITEIPIYFSGEKALKSRGGIIQKEKTNLKIECMSDNLPQSIQVDISNLKRGAALRVGDIEISQEISILDDKNSVILSITKANTNIVDSVADHEDDLDVLKDNNPKESESSLY